MAASRKGWGGAVVLGLALVVLAAAAAWPATFTVDSTADAGDVLGGDGACQAAGGACTLRAAVQEANMLGGADRIVLPAGRFRLALSGAGEDAAVTGDLDVLDDLEIEGAGQGVTILDGLAGDRVLHVVGSHALTLVGMTVRNGSLPGSTGGGVGVPAGALTLRGVRIEGNAAQSAGGVAQGNGALVIVDSTFANNVAGGGNGGGLYKAGTGTVDITASTFTGNHAFSGGDAGGALITNDAAVVIRESVFSVNSAADVGALAVVSGGALTISGSRIADSLATGNTGGLYYAGPGPVSVTATTISGNVAIGQYGGARLQSAANAIEISGSTVADNLGASSGGLFVDFTAGGSFAMRDAIVSGNAAVSGAVGGVAVQGAVPVVLEDVEVRDNVAAQAGGMYLAGQTDAAIRRCRFTGNRSGGSVGGLYDSGGGPTVIEASTFANNAAFNGSAGGVYRTGTAGGLTIGDSTFANNVAVGGGGVAGGVYDASPAASAVSNSTFSGNWAPTGGAFVAATAVGFTNCTFAGNGASTGNGADVWNGAAVTLARTILADAAAGTSCGGVAFVSGGYNLDEGGSCALAGAGDVSGVDPQLGTLADNGGPTWTHALAATSPAVDAAGGTCAVTDQRGTARPADGNGDGTAACDIGAYEFVDACPDDPAKTAPGTCGCGVADVDANANGAVDCLVNAELKARIARAKTLVAGLANDGTPAQRTVRQQLRAEAKGITGFVRQHRAAITLANPRAKLPRLARRAAAASRAAARRRGGGLAPAQTRADAALDALDAAVAAS